MALISESFSDNISQHPGHQDVLLQYRDLFVYGSFEIETSKHIKLLIRSTMDNLPAEEEREKYA